MSGGSHRSSAAHSHSTPTSSSTARQPPSQAERAADARIAFLNSLKVASSDVDTELKLRAKNIYDNQEAVSKQDAELQKKIKQLAKDNAETEKWLSKHQQKLAEFDDWGDIGDGLEDDLDDLEAMLDMLEQQERDGKVDNQDKSV